MSLKSSEAVRVKEEPEWESGPSETKMKHEKLQPDLPCVSNLYTKEEGSEQCNTMDSALKEDSWDCGVSEAGLYEDCEIKSELIMELELLQPSQVTCATDSLDVKVEVDIVKQEPVHFGNSPGAPNISGETQPAGTCAVDPGRVVVSKKPHICKVCYRIFDLETSLIDHMQVHGAEETRPRSNVVYNLCKFRKVQTRFSCDTCGQRCVSKSHLICHNRKHSGEKPFVCNICHKAFAQKSNLSKHVTVHTDEKPFSCDICKKQFSHKAGVSHHMKCHYKKVYPCEICKEEFPCKKLLIEHVDVHSKVLWYSCDKCPKKFKREHDLNHHMLIHTCVEHMRLTFLDQEFQHGNKHFPYRRKSRRKTRGKN